MPSYLALGFDAVAVHIVDTATQRLPRLLDAASTALKRLPLPSSSDDVSAQLDMAQVLALAPFCSAVLAIVTVVVGKAVAEPTATGGGCRYWLTRRWLLRSMGAIYFVAFWTSAFQGRAIYGTHGLLPVDPAGVGARRPVPAFSALRWATGEPFSDWMLELVSWTGLTLAMLLAANPARSAAVPAALWVLYLSIVNLETIVMNYGWEWLTLELGFLAIFLCPICWPPGCGIRFPRHHAPPGVVIWLFKWCAFRLLIGAGMSKCGTRSSDCWAELSCTKTHYFTQPMPNRLSWLAHQAPDWFHEAEVALTFAEQLALPFFLLVPLRRVGIAAGLLEVFLQFGIVVTGNYAWINFVGCLPCIAVLDDQFLSQFYKEADLAELAGCAIDATQDFTAEPDTNFPGSPRTPKASRVGRLPPSPHAEKPRVLGTPMKPPVIRITRRVGGALWAAHRHAVGISLLLFILFKSTAPLQELFSPSPWLHYYDEYFFVNSQGVFGFINAKRAVAVLSYTHDPVVGTTAATATCVDNPTKLSFREGCDILSAHCGHAEHGKMIRTGCRRSCGLCPVAKDVTWRPIEFKNLPGAVDRASYFSSPYHYRLDWEIWIHTTASMENARGKHQGAPAVLKSLINKVLAGDTDTIGLLETSPELLLNSSGIPPTAIALQYYWYTFTNSSTLMDTGAWWSRTKLGDRVVFLPKDGGPSSSPAPRTGGYWQRHWIMMWCSRGIALVAGDAFTADCAAGSTARTLAIFLVSYATCFAMAFAGDYPAEFGSWKVFFDRMHAAEGEPFTAVDVTNAITAVCVVAVTTTRQAFPTGSKHTINLLLVAALAISRGTD